MAAVGEVRLWNNKQEQDLQESYADLYAIIKTTEKLERAFVRDAITPDEYERACQRLLQQFKMIRNSISSAVPNIEQFMCDYNMQCSMAATRLLHSGMPATVEHRNKPSGGKDHGAAAVAETTAHFITAMDSLKLNLVAVDQIAPIMMDLMNSMGKIQGLPPNFGPLDKAKEWYQRLYQKPANYELPDEDVRQLLYELEAAYNAFLGALRAGAL